ncbi:hypothetical protein B0H13DRAFT_1921747 [Mycena leptocephala]|nr:hypothetical protein B0H13DRAFT_1921747 [Mycena leptocephala]
MFHRPDAQRAWNREECARDSDRTHLPLLDAYEKSGKRRERGRVKQSESTPCLARATAPPARAPNIRNLRTETLAVPSNSPTSSWSGACRRRSVQLLMSMEQGYNVLGPGSSANFIDVRGAGWDARHRAVRGICAQGISVSFRRADVATKIKPDPPRARVRMIRHPKPNLSSIQMTYVAVSARCTKNGAERAGGKRKQSYRHALSGSSRAKQEQQCGVACRHVFHSPPHSPKPNNKGTRTCLFGTRGASKVTIAILLVCLAVLNDDVPVRRHCECGGWPLATRRETGLGLGQRSEAGLQAEASRASGQQTELALRGDGGTEKGLAGNVNDRPVSIRLSRFPSYQLVTDPSDLRRPILKIWLILRNTILVLHSALPRSALLRKIKRANLAKILLQLTNSKLATSWLAQDWLPVLGYHEEDSDHYI